MSNKRDGLLPDGKCRYCGMKPIVGEGRRLGLTTEQIEGILRHYTATHPKNTQTQYCRQEKIGLKTYWRVTHLRLSHPKDREKVIIVADSIGYDIMRAKVR